MRLLLKNCVRDPKYRHLRQRRGLIPRRPVVLGRPLPPGATRAIPSSAISKAVLLRIEELMDLGCVALFTVGPQGSEVTAAEIAEVHGIVLHEKAPEEVSTQESDVSPSIAEHITEVVEDIDEPIVEAVPAVAADIVEEVPPLEEEAAPIHTLATLMQMRKADMTALLTEAGGEAPTGATKKVIANAILSILDAK